tara:strand:+ start:604 stop:852 length:249 start_codon:yes stop_codon:yes gene_type:complete
MKTINITLIQNGEGVFAFTKDESNNLVYQEIGNHNNFYFSFDPNEGGNLNNDWEIVEMNGLDDEYKDMVETAIKQLKGNSND